MMPHPFERRFKQKMRRSAVAKFGRHGGTVTNAAPEPTDTPHYALEVKRVDPDARREAATLLTRAFAADPPARFLYPELDRFMRVFPRYIEAFAGASFERGEAYGIADLKGAALWLPPGAQPDETALDLLFAETIPAGRRAEVSEIVKRLGNYHPSEPHWHLAMIGVDPDEVRKGYGSALLQAGLGRVDNAGGTAYLESTNAQNLPLYESFGFKLVGTINTGRCPPIYPMVRRIA